MIYGNKGGKIGFSSSKSNNCQKKLFTPIQLSLPNVSDIDNHIENNLNSPRKIDNKNQNDINLTFTHRISNKNLTHIPKVQFNIPMKKKYSSTNNSPDKNNNQSNNDIQNKNEKDLLDNNKLVFLKRSQSKQSKKLYKSLLLFDENFDILVKSIKSNKEKKN